MTQSKRFVYLLLALAASLAMLCGMPHAADAAALIPVTALPPQTAPPAFQKESALPDLMSFALSVANGNGDELVGVYAPELFAFPVVPQPVGDAAFVSPAEDVVTRFGLAERYGSTGLLAHNYLAGASFDQLEEEQRIVLVFGDGHVGRYRVAEVRVFRALRPYSPYSDFEDMESHVVLSAADLFLQTYALKGLLIFQTCLKKEGSDSWGRIFVIAEPVEKFLRDPL